MAERQPHPDDWRPNPGPQTRFLSLTCREALYGGAAGGGKLLRVDEPIPTPSGWTTMGEVRPGDTVFDADGKLTTVVWCSEVEQQPDAWALTFDDGTEIECDAGHQWLTLTAAERNAALRRTDEFRAKRRESRPSKVGGRKSKAFTDAITARNAARAGALTEPIAPRGYARKTSEIVESLRVGKSGRANHSIVNAGALDLPDAELVVPPYTLGAWLGDGSTGGGGLTGLDAEVWENVEADGFVVTHGKRPVTHYIRGLVGRLRSVGVLKNKHVPTEYLRASRQQRIALLQGLCDTDGHATEKGSIEFTTTSEALRDGVVELLATLGVKPSCREGIATLYGVAVSKKWRIQFWAEFQCFRIQRKAVRQKLSGFRGVHSSRFVVGARRVEPSPMRCIGVDSPTHTYLAGRRMVPTHNSDALLVDAIRYVGRGYGAACKSLLLRRTFPDLEKSLIERSRELYPIIGGRYNQQSKVWRFPQGESVWFGYLEHEDDVRQYQSAAFSFIGFDELTHFSERQYLYLFSRCRSAAGVPLRIRSGTNPGGPGHAWVFKRWGAWLDPESSFKAASGEVVYVARNDDDADDVCDADNPLAISRTFVPARLSDNPFIADDGEYAKNLQNLQRVERAQLRDGNWLIKPAAGEYFKRAWFGDPVEHAPADVVSRIRYWDRASTGETEAAKRKGKRDADYTVGLRLSKTAGGIYYVEDVVRLRGTPGEVKSTIRQTAEVDGKGVLVGLEEDPGQAGQFEMAEYMTYLDGFAVKAFPARVDKITRCKPASTQAEAGNMRLVKGAWNAAFLSETEDFPDGLHDDIVDALSGAHNSISASGFKAPKLPPVEPRASIFGDTETPGW